VSATRARAGVTLVELLVVLAILGISAAVVAVNARIRGERPHVGNVEAAVRAAREEAVRDGHPATRVAVDDSTTLRITVLPDDEVIVPDRRSPNGQRAQVSR